MVDVHARVGKRNCMRPGHWLLCPCHGGDQYSNGQRRQDESYAHRFILRRAMPVCNKNI